MTFVDRSLEYGQSVFFFCNEYTNVASGDDYDYVVYMDKKGEILIARFNSAGDEGRYYAVVGNYATVVSSLHQYTIDNRFVLPNGLEDQKI